MLIRLFDVFTVVSAAGPEYDIGELVTYLNDAVLIAPSMLLVPEVAWYSVDANSFDVALRDPGRTVTARVTIDECGAPKDFSTADRFYTDPDNPKRTMRARWTTPVAAWQVFDGRRIPVAGQATWHRSPMPTPASRLGALRSISLPRGSRYDDGSTVTVHRRFREVFRRNSA